MALIKKYLQDTADLHTEYGEKSIVLIQVGAFYEVYGLLNSETGTITGSTISDYASLCELSVAKKNVCIGEKNVMMAGFRDYMLDKYLNKLQGFGYTVAVYSQDEKAAGTTRSLSGIYSPGTYFSNDATELTNNTMCVWLEKINNTIIVGISNIDIYTGKSVVFEYNQEYAKTPDAYDELERYVSIYQPSELIVIHNLSSTIIDDILHFVDTKTQCRHIIDKNDACVTHKTKVLNCEKQPYKIEIIKKYFNQLNDEILTNLTQYPIGGQSYCYLLDFIYYHNPDLTKKILPPLFENSSERLLLGNHSLKQLNIINSSLTGTTGTNSSVSSFLNQCKTPMGKRKFHYMMLNPLTNSDVLQDEYDYCEHLLIKNDVAEMREKLTNMRDLEKLSRKIVLKKITPGDCFHMNASLLANKDIFNNIENDIKSNNYVFKRVSDKVNTYSDALCTLIEKVLVLDKIRDKNSLLFDENFINPGYDKEHDETVETWEDSYDILIGIQQFLNEKVAIYERSKSKSSVFKKSEYVKIHATEKSGSSLTCTSRRATILITQLKGLKIVNIPFFSKYKNENKLYALDLSLINCDKTTGTNMTIISPEIKKVCTLVLSSKHVMLDSLSRLYNRFITELYNNITQLDEIVKFISLVDYSYTRAYIADKYNLCKPTITKSETAFFTAKGIRHILIESLLRDEHYVTNDLSMDDNNLGVLLYGTNAVGKSSFIRAVGISIIMAQSGFYVPCSELNFSPYKHIFTRILGNDNLFKGLSSFAVEMLELKTILSLSDKDSLVLGDELCSGTESNSAMSIFISGIQHLYKRNSNFIFATHFHEIVELEEIQEMDALRLMHMGVYYDKIKDKLIYDRKLRDGPGENMYGLEVCKALHLPTAFLENAHALRNKYNQKTASMLEWKPSRYNKQKLRGVCEECKINFCTEIHHIEPQKKAQENGFIGSFHKNHLANLRALCEKCHLKEHHG